MRLVHSVFSGISNICRFRSICSVQASSSMHSCVMHTLCAFIASVIHTIYLASRNSHANGAIECVFVSPHNRSNLRLRIS